MRKKLFKDFGWERLAARSGFCLCFAHFPFSHLHIPTQRSLLLLL